MRQTTDADGKIHAVVGSVDEDVYYVRQAGGGWRSTLEFTGGADTSISGAGGSDYSDWDINFSHGVVYLSLSETVYFRDDPDPFAPFEVTHRLKCRTYRDGERDAFFSRESPTRLDHVATPAVGGGMWFYMSGQPLLRVTSPGALGDPVAVEGFALSLPALATESSVAIAAGGADLLHLVFSTQVSTGPMEDAYTVGYFAYQPSTETATESEVFSGSGFLANDSLVRQVLVTSGSEGEPVVVFHLRDPSDQSLKAGRLLPDGTWDVQNLSTGGNFGFEVGTSGSGEVTVAYQTDSSSVDRLHVAQLGGTSGWQFDSGLAAQLFSLDLAVHPSGLYFVGGIDQGDDNVKFFFSPEVADSVDLDSNGLSQLEEDAFRGPIGGASLPIVILVVESGKTYMELRYSRLSGGEQLAPNQHYVAERDILYVVETSTDLVNWTPDPNLITESIPFSFFGTDSVFVRLNAALEDGERVYMRMRLQRGQ